MFQVKKTGQINFVCRARPSLLDLTEIIAESGLSSLDHPRSSRKETIPSPEWNNNWRSTFSYLISDPKIEWNHNYTVYSKSIENV